MAESKSALIVGASRGIGLGLAEEFARRGWRVTATVRDADGETALARAAPDIRVERVDVADAGTIDALVGRLSSEQLDLVVVNAGVNTPRHQSVDAVTAEELGALLLTNAIGPLRLARRLLPQLPDGGTIAFMSSAMGSVADNKSGGEDLYRMSKAALNMLARGFDAREARDRVRVLVLHPGWVKTDMGGSNAPLSVEESARGLADVLERPEGVPTYVDYQGRQLAW